MARDHTIEFEDDDCDFSDEEPRTLNVSATATWEAADRECGINGGWLVDTLYITDVDGKEVEVSPADYARLQRRADDKFADCDSASDMDYSDRADDEYEYRYGC